MPSIANIKNSNADITAGDMPRVAVFVGATAGIAKAALTLLVSKKTPIRVYILGRNEVAHKPFLDELRASNDEATIIWLEGLVSLLSETQRLCSEIIIRERSIDLLFLCAGYLPFGGRVETSEGFETSLALNLWTRTLFATKLLPLLQATPPLNPTYTPRVITILGAGMESATIPLDDLDLRQPRNFSFMNEAHVAVTLTTLFFSRLAAHPANQRIVFIHNHPVIVRTGFFNKNDSTGNNWGPLLAGVMRPLLRLFSGSIDVETSAERCLYLITSAEYGGEGVELRNGVARGRTDTDLETGGLFCVTGEMECFQPEQAVRELEAKGGVEIALEKIQEVIQPYL